MRTRVLFASLAVVVALAGCSGDKTVSGSELEKQVAPVVEKKAGVKPTDVKCKELKAEVKATSSCTLKLKGESYKLKITATSVDGNNVKFDIEQE